MLTEDDLISGDLTLSASMRLFVRPRPGVGVVTLTGNGYSLRFEDQEDESRDAAAGGSAIGLRLEPSKIEPVLFVQQGVTVNILDIMLENYSERFVRLDPQSRIAGVVELENNSGWDSPGGGGKGDPQNKAKAKLSRLRHNLRRKTAGEQDPMISTHETLDGNIGRRFAEKGDPIMSSTHDTAEYENTSATFSQDGTQQRDGNSSGDINSRQLPPSPAGEFIPELPARCRLPSGTPNPHSSLGCVCSV